MSELTDNDTKTIKLIVDETSDAVVRKLTSTIYYNNTDSLNCVLDKIKTEIEEVYNDRPRSYNHTQRRELFCKVIEIVDKYKTEEE